LVNIVGKPDPQLMGDQEEDGAETEGGRHHGQAQGEATGFARTAELPTNRGEFRSE